MIASSLIQEMSLMLLIGICGGFFLTQNTSLPHASNPKQNWWKHACGYLENTFLLLLFGAIMMLGAYIRTTTLSVAGEQSWEIFSLSFSLECNGVWLGRFLKKLSRW